VTGFADRNPARIAASPPSIEFFLAFDTFFSHMTRKFLLTLRILADLGDFGQLFALFALTLLVTAPSRARFTL
jgi:hypothetical protein